MQPLLSRSFESSIGLKDQASSRLSYWDESKGKSVKSLKEKEFIMIIFK